MMLNKLKLTGVALMGALAFASLSSVAAEADGEKKAEAPVKKKKKGPTKKPEYFRWKDAAAVAEAWEQPVIVFIDLEDSKPSSRVRAATVGHRLFKDFVKSNCVYYRYRIPRIEAKKGRGGRSQNNKKVEDVPKPNYEEVKPSEMRIIDLVVDKKAAKFPGIALLKADGQLLGSIDCDVESPSLEAFVKDLTALFKKGDYEITVPKSIQKLIDAEIKKRAALEKKKKK